MRFGRESERADWAGFEVEGVRGFGSVFVSGVGVWLVEEDETGRRAGAGMR